MKNCCFLPIIDIDECAMDVNICEHNCTNIAGAYYCSCLDGYTADQNEINCTGIIYTYTSGIKKKSP